MKQHTRSSTEVHFRHVTVAVGLALFMSLAVMGNLISPVRAVSQAGWTVLAVEGDASWRGIATKVGGWQELLANAELPDGAEIRTGGNGSAVVAKGLDRIEIRASTLVVVAASVAGNATQMYQASGSATYTVEKRPAGTFSVRTPYVLAVVKGTRFDVDISRNETGVSVREGRVSVSDQRNGNNVEVTPGETARARADAPGLDVGRSSAGSPAPGTKAATETAPGLNGTAGSTAATGKAAGSANGKALGKTAAGATGVLGDALNGTTGTLGDTVSGTAQSLGDTASGVGNSAAGAVGNLGDALGGGKGGGSGSGGGGSGGDTGGGSGGGSGGSEGGSSDSGSGESDTGSGTAGGSGNSNAGGNGNAGGLGDAVGGALDDVGDAVGGALGDLGGGLGGGGLGGLGRDNH